MDEPEQPDLNVLYHIYHDNNDVPQIGYAENMVNGAGNEAAANIMAAGAANIGANQDNAAINPIAGVPLPHHDPAFNSASYLEAIEAIVGAKKMNTEEIQREIRRLDGLLLVHKFHEEHLGNSLQGLSQTVQNESMQLTILRREKQQLLQTVENKNTVIDAMVEQLAERTNNGQVKDARIAELVEQLAERTNNGRVKDARIAELEREAASMKIYLNASGLMITAQESVIRRQVGPEIAAQIFRNPQQIRHQIIELPFDFHQEEQMRRLLHENIMALCRFQIMEDNPGVQLPAIEVIEAQVDAMEQSDEEEGGRDEEEEEEEHHNEIPNAQGAEQD